MISRSSSLLSIFLFGTFFLQNVSPFSSPLGYKISSSTSIPHPSLHSFASATRRTSQTRRYAQQQNQNTSSDESSRPLLLPDGVPSYKTLCRFVGTTILILLSEPLLSLVDTTIVGQTASIVQLASLGPATMLIDSSIYLTYFLAISTTNAMATKMAQADYAGMVQTSGHVLSVAAALGGMVTALCWGFGGLLLTRLGGSSATPELLHLALNYVKVRSAVAPLAIMGMVAQSICLAGLDTTTPAVAVAVASLINISGDFLLVPRWGVVGAAGATAMANVAATGILVNQVTKKIKRWRAQDLAVNPVQATPTNEMNNKKKMTAFEQFCSTVKAKLHMAGPLSDLSWPDNASLFQLLRLAGPIFFVIVGKIICYSSMNLRATDFGLVALASHNIMMRIFFFYATFGDSLSQASQTFVPQVLVGMGKNNKQQVYKLMSRLSVMAAGIGLVNTNVASYILRKCGTYFTKQPGILITMAEQSTYLCLALLLHPFIMLFEGAIIATKDLGYLVKTYVCTMVLLLGLLQFSSATFHGVWRALFIFQTMRLVQFAHRVWAKMVVSSQRDLIATPVPT